MTFAVNETPPELNPAIDHLVEVLQSVEDLSEFRRGLLISARWAQAQMLLGPAGDVAAHAKAVEILMALDAVTDALSAVSCALDTAAATVADAADWAEEPTDG